MEREKVKTMHSKGYPARSNDNTTRNGKSKDFTRIVLNKMKQFGTAISNDPNRMYAEDDESKEIDIEKVGNYIRNGAILQGELSGVGLTHTGYLAPDGRSLIMDLTTKSPMIPDHIKNMYITSSDGSQVYNLYITVEKYRVGELAMLAYNIVNVSHMIPELFSVHKGTEISSLVMSRVYITPYAFNSEDKRETESEVKSRIARHSMSNLGRFELLLEHLGEGEHYLTESGFIWDVEEMMSVYVPSVEGVRFTLRKKFLNKTLRWDDIIGVDDDDNNEDPRIFIESGLLYRGYGLYALNNWILNDPNILNETIKNMSIETSDGSEEDIQVRRRYVDEDRYEHLMRHLILRGKSNDATWFSRWNGSSPANISKRCFNIFAKQLGKQCISIPIGDLAFDYGGQIDPHGVTEILTDGLKSILYATLAAYHKFVIQTGTYFTVIEKTADMMLNIPARKLIPSVYEEAYKFADRSITKEERDSIASDMHNVTYRCIYYTAYSSHSKVVEQYKTVIVSVSPKGDKTGKYHAGPIPSQTDYENVGEGNDYYTPKYWLLDDSNTDEDSADAYEQKLNDEKLKLKRLEERKADELTALEDVKNQMSAQTGDTLKELKVKEDELMEVVTSINKKIKLTAGYIMKLREFAMIVYIYDLLFKDEQSDISSLKVNLPDLDVLLFPGAPGNDDVVVHLSMDDLDDLITLPNNFTRPDSSEQDDTVMDSEAFIKSFREYLSDLEENKYMQMSINRSKDIVDIYGKIDVSTLSTVMLGSIARKIDTKITKEDEKYRMKNIYGDVAGTGTRGGFYHILRDQIMGSQILNNNLVKIIEEINDAISDFKQNAGTYIYKTDSGSSVRSRSKERRGTKSQYEKSLSALEGHFSNITDRYTRLIEQTYLSGVLLRWPLPLDDMFHEKDVHSFLLTGRLMDTVVSFMECVIYKLTRELMTFDIVLPKDMYPTDNLVKSADYGLMLNPNSGLEDFLKDLYNEYEIDPVSYNKRYDSFNATHRAAYILLHSRRGFKTDRSTKIDTMFVENDRYYSFEFLRKKSMMNYSIYSDLSEKYDNALQALWDRVSGKLFEFFRSFVSDPNKYRNLPPRSNFARNYNIHDEVRFGFENIRDLYSSVLSGIDEKNYGASLEPRRWKLIKEYLKLIDSTFWKLANIDGDKRHYLTTTRTPNVDLMFTHNDIAANCARLFLFSNENTAGSESHDHIYERISNIHDTLYHGMGSFIHPDGSWMKMQIWTGVIESALVLKSISSTIGAGILSLAHDCALLGLVNIEAGDSANPKLLSLINSILSENASNGNNDDDDEIKSGKMKKYIWMDESRYMKSLEEMVESDEYGKLEDKGQGDFALLSETTSSYDNLNRYIWQSIDDLRGPHEFGYSMLMQDSSFYDSLVVKSGYVSNNILLPLMDMLEYEKNKLSPAVQRLTTESGLHLIESDDDDHDIYTYVEMIYEKCKERLLILRFLINEGMVANSYEGFIAFWSRMQYVLDDVYNYRSENNVNVERDLLVKVPMLFVIWLSLSSLQMFTMPDVLVKMHQIILNYMMPEWKINYKYVNVEQKDSESERKQYTIDEIFYRLPTTTFIFTGGIQSYPSIGTLGEGSNEVLADEYEFVGMIGSSLYAEKLTINEEVSTMRSDELYIFNLVKNEDISIDVDDYEDEDKLSRAYEIKLMGVMNKADKLSNFYDDGIKNGFFHDIWSMFSSVLETDYYESFILTTTANKIIPSIYYKYVQCLNFMRAVEDMMDHIYHKEPIRMRDGVGISETLARISTLTADSVKVNGDVKFYVYGIIDNKVLRADSNYDLEKLVVGITQLDEDESSLFRQFKVENVEYLTYGTISIPVYEILVKYDEAADFNLVSGSKYTITLVYDGDEVVHYDDVYVSESMQLIGPRCQYKLNDSRSRDTITHLSSVLGLGREDDPTNNILYDVIFGKLLARLYKYRKRFNYTSKVTNDNDSIFKRWKLEYEQDKVISNRTVIYTNSPNEDELFVYKDPSALISMYCYWLYDNLFVPDDVVKWSADELFNGRANHLTLTWMKLYKTLKSLHILSSMITNDTFVIDSTDKSVGKKETDSRRRFMRSLGRKFKLRLTELITNLIPKSMINKYLPKNIDGTPLFSSGKGNIMNRSILYSVDIESRFPKRYHVLHTMWKNTGIIKMENSVIEELYGRIIGTTISLRKSIPYLPLGISNLNDHTPYELNDYTNTYATMRSQIAHDYGVFKKEIASVMYRVFFNDNDAILKEFELKKNLGLRKTDASRVDLYNYTFHGLLHQTLRMVLYITIWMRREAHVEEATETKSWKKGHDIDLNEALIILMSDNNIMQFPNSKVFANEIYKYDDVKKRLPSLAEKFEEYYEVEKDKTWVISSLDALKSETEARENIFEPGDVEETEESEEEVIPESERMTRDLIWERFLTRYALYISQMDPQFDLLLRENARKSKFAPFMREWSEMIGNREEFLSSDKRITIDRRMRGIWAVEKLDTNSSIFNLVLMLDQQDLRTLFGFCYTLSMNIVRTFHSRESKGSLGDRYANTLSSYLRGIQTSKVANNLTDVTRLVSFIGDPTSVMYMARIFGVDWSLHAYLLTSTLVEALRNIIIMTRTFSEEVEKLRSHTLNVLRAWGKSTKEYAGIFKNMHLRLDDIKSKFNKVVHGRASPEYRFDFNLSKTLRATNYDDSVAKKIFKMFVLFSGLLEKVDIRTSSSPTDIQGDIEVLMDRIQAAQIRTEHESYIKSGKETTSGIAVGGKVINSYNSTTSSSLVKRVGDRFKYRYDNTTSSDGSNIDKYLDACSIVKVCVNALSNSNFAYAELNSFESVTDNPSTLGGIVESTLSLDDLILVARNYTIAAIDAALIDQRVKDLKLGDKPQLVRKLSTLSVSLHDEMYSMGLYPRNLPAVGAFTPSLFGDPLYNAYLEDIMNVFTDRKKSNWSDLVRNILSSDQAERLKIVKERILEFMRGIKEFWYRDETYKFLDTVNEEMSAGIGSEPDDDVAYYDGAFVQGIFNESWKDGLYHSTWAYQNINHLGEGDYNVSIVELLNGSTFMVLLYGGFGYDRNGYTDNRAIEFPHRVNERLHVKRDTSLSRFEGSTISEHTLYKFKSQLKALNMDNKSFVGIRESIAKNVRRIQLISERIFTEDVDIGTKRELGSESQLASVLNSALERGKINKTEIKMTLPRTIMFGYRDSEPNLTNDDIYSSLHEIYIEGFLSMVKGFTGINSGNLPENFSAVYIISYIYEMFKHIMESNILKSAYSEMSESYDLRIKYINAPIAGIMNKDNWNIDWKAVVNHVRIFESTLKNKLNEFGKSKVLTDPANATNMYIDMRKIIRTKIKELSFDVRELRLRRLSFITAYSSKLRSRMKMDKGGARTLIWKLSSSVAIYDVIRYLRDLFEENFDDESIIRYFDALLDIPTMVSMYQISAMTLFESAPVKGPRRSKPDTYSIPSYHAGGSFDEYYLWPKFNYRTPDGRAFMSYVNVASNMLGHSLSNVLNYPTLALGDVNKVILKELPGVNDVLIEKVKVDGKYIFDAVNSVTLNNGDYYERMVAYAWSLNKPELVAAATDMLQIPRIDVEKLVGPYERISLTPVEIRSISDSENKPSQTLAYRSYNTVRGLVSLKMMDNHTNSSAFSRLMYETSKYMDITLNAGRRFPHEIHKNDPRVSIMWEDVLREGKNFREFFAGKSYTVLGTGEYKDRSDEGHLEYASRFYYRRFHHDKQMVDIERYYRLWTYYNETISKSRVDTTLDFALSTSFIYSSAAFDCFRVGWNPTLWNDIIHNTLPALDTRGDGATVNYRLPFIGLKVTDDFNLSEEIPENIVDPTKAEPGLNGLYTIAVTEDVNTSNMARIYHKEAKTIHVLNQYIKYSESLRVHDGYDLGEDVEIVEESYRNNRTRELHDHANGIHPKVKIDREARKGPIVYEIGSTYVEDEWRYDKDRYDERTVNASYFNSDDHDYNNMSYMLKAITFTKTMIHNMYLNAKSGDTAPLSTYIKEMMEQFGANNPNDDVHLYNMSYNYRIFMDWDNIWSKYVQKALTYVYLVKLFRRDYSVGEIDSGDDEISWFQGNPFDELYPYINVPSMYGSEYVSALLDNNESRFTIFTKYNVLFYLDAVIHKMALNSGNEDPYPFGAQTTLEKGEDRHLNVMKSSVLFNMLNPNGASPIKGYAREDLKAIVDLDGDYIRIKPSLRNYLSDSDMMNRIIRVYPVLFYLYEQDRDLPPLYAQPSTGVNLLLQMDRQGYLGNMTYDPNFIGNTERLSMALGRGTKPRHNSRYHYTEAQEGMALALLYLLEYFGNLAKNSILDVGMMADTSNINFTTVGTTVKTTPLTSDRLRNYFTILNSPKMLIYAQHAKDGMQDVQLSYAHAQLSILNYVRPGWYASKILEYSKDSASTLSSFGGLYGAGDISTYREPLKELLFSSEIDMAMNPDLYAKNLDLWMVIRNVKLLSLHRRSKSNGYLWTESVWSTHVDHVTADKIAGYISRYDANRFNHVLRTENAVSKGAVTLNYSTHNIEFKRSIDPGRTPANPPSIFKYGALAIDWMRLGKTNIDGITIFDKTERLKYAHDMSAIIFEWKDLKDITDAMATFHLGMKDELRYASKMRERSVGTIVGVGDELPTGLMSTEISEEEEEDLSYEMSEEEETESISSLDEEAEFFLSSDEEAESILLTDEDYYSASDTGDDSFRAVWIKSADDISNSSLIMERINKTLKDDVLDAVTDLPSLKLIWDEMRKNNREFHLVGMEDLIKDDARTAYNKRIMSVYGLPLGLIYDNGVPKDRRLETGPWEPIKDIYAAMDRVSKKLGLNRSGFSLVPSVRYAKMGSKVQLVVKPLTIKYYESVTPASSLKRGSNELPSIADEFGGMSTKLAYFKPRYTRAEYNFETYVLHKIERNREGGFNVNEIIDNDHGVFEISIDSYLDYTYYWCLRVHEGEGDGKWKLDGISSILLIQPHGNMLATPGSTLSMQNLRFTFTSTMLTFGDMSNFRGRIEEFADFMDRYVSRSIIKKFIVSAFLDGFRDLQFEGVDMDLRHAVILDRLLLEYTISDADHTYVLKSLWNRFHDVVNVELKGLGKYKYGSKELNLIHEQVDAILENDDDIRSIVGDALLKSSFTMITLHKQRVKMDNIEGMINIYVKSMGLPFVQAREELENLKEKFRTLASAGSDEFARTIQRSDVLDRFYKSDIDAYLRYKYATASANNLESEDCLNNILLLYASGLHLIYDLRGADGDDVGVMMVNSLVNFAKGVPCYRKFPDHGAYLDNLVASKYENNVDYDALIKSSSAKVPVRSPNFSSMVQHSKSLNPKKYVFYSGVYGSKIADQGYRCEVIFNGNDTFKHKQKKHKKKLNVKLFGAKSMCRKTRKHEGAHNKNSSRSSSSIYRNKPKSARRTCDTFNWSDAKNKSRKVASFRNRAIKITHNGKTHGIKKITNTNGNGVVMMKHDRVQTVKSADKNVEVLAANRKKNGGTHADRMVSFCSKLSNLENCKSVSAIFGAFIIKGYTLREAFDNTCNILECYRQS